MLLDPGSGCASPHSIDGVAFGVGTWSTSRISTVQVGQMVLDHYITSYISSTTYAAGGLSLFPHRFPLLSISHIAFTVFYHRTRPDEIYPVHVLHLSEPKPRSSVGRPHAALPAIIASPHFLLGGQQVRYMSSPCVHVCNSVCVSGRFPLKTSIYMHMRLRCKAPPI